MSGLRDELAALADEWDTSSTWDHETPCEDSEDCARCCARDLRALLDRFPPEADHQDRPTAPATEQEGT